MLNHVQYITFVDRCPTLTVPPVPVVLIRFPDLTILMIQPKLIAGCLELSRALCSYNHVNVCVRV